MPEIIVIVITERWLPLGSVTFLITVMRSEKVHHYRKEGTTDEWILFLIAWQNSQQKQFKEGKVDLAPSLRVQFVVIGNVWWQGLWSGWSHWVYSQEAERGECWNSVYFLLLLVFFKIHLIICVHVCLCRSKSMWMQWGRGVRNRGALCGEWRYVCSLVVGVTGNYELVLWDSSSMHS